MKTTDTLLVLGFLATATWSASAPVRQAESAAPDSTIQAKTGFAAGEDKKQDAKPKKGKGKITIGKETTYVDGAVGKDGYIDYVAALNKRLGQSVTPANNANVLLWKALGPHPEGANMPGEFFRLMGIKAPPEKGGYYIDVFPFMKDHIKAITVTTKIEQNKAIDDLYELLDRLMERPWTAKEQTHMAAWLKANEKPLAVVVQATKRSHYFSPLVPSRPNDGLVTALLPGVQKCRELATALVARAMLRAGQGDLDGAWQDLLACHRLGRLLARGGTLIEGLVGIAINAIAVRADLAFLGRTRLSAKQIQNCLDDLQKLPPMPAMADKVDLAERFMFLELVTMIDRGGIQCLNVLGGGRGIPNDLADRFLENIDWDPALKNGNRWYDRLVAAMRLKDRAAREKKLSTMEAELKALKGRFSETDKLLEILGGKQAPTAKGKIVGDILICLLVPAVRKVQSAADRTGQIQDNLSLAFALAWYQRDHGRYPEKLDALAPKYLPQIPQDVFAGKSLVYRPTKKGYLLYSVGVNGKDDGGRGYDDDPPGDDLVVRMPLPELRRK